MRTFRSAIQKAAEINPISDPLASPGKFIAWAEDICELIAYIYECDYDDVVHELTEELGLLDDEEE